MMQNEVCLRWPVAETERASLIDYSHEYKHVIRRCEKTYPTHAPLRKTDTKSISQAGPDRYQAVLRIKNLPLHSGSLSLVHWG